MKAEKGYLEADRAYKACGDIVGQAWVLMNYAEGVIAHTDMPRAVEMAKEAADTTPHSANKGIALCFYAMGLADMGHPAEAVRVGEEVFASRLQSTDLTERARSYGDLAHLYRKVGRPEAAEPLLKEGVRRLRETGIQDILLETLLVLAETSGDSDEIRELLAEANAIASRLGSNAKLLEVARSRMRWAAAQGYRLELIAAVEDAFRYVQINQSELERRRTLKALADSLAQLGKAEYSNAVLATLGEPAEEAIHPGWKALMSSDSHATICVHAVVMAKEAINSGA
jgi:tetratricopeptide (TPR) repeat protein